MIKNIIFDFGDIFINLDKIKFKEELNILGINSDNKEFTSILNNYEMGLLSSTEFFSFFEKKIAVSSEDLKIAWNSILLNFPEHRLAFLKELTRTKKYRLFLISNTNDLHISWIQKNWGMNLYNEFKSCFEQFYLSHEIKMRKPNANIYEFVLHENNLKANETLFVDDTKENTDAATILGIKVWNLIPGKEDVTELFTKKEFTI